MKIVLDQLGKRFRFEWIFKNLEATLTAGEQWAVLGPNGSGKSTLLKILSGHLTPTKGQVRFQLEGRTVEPDEVYRHVAYAAPYIEFIEEFTLQEAVDFHKKLKPLLPGLQTPELIELLELPGAKHKAIRYFSSGMKQRLKLALAICSRTHILLLDEPSTNLDREATHWFHRMLDRFADGRLVVIATNEQSDVAHCQHFIHIAAFKK